MGGIWTGGGLGIGDRVWGDGRWVREAAGGEVRGGVRLSGRNLRRVDVVDPRRGGLQLPHDVLILLPHLAPQQESTGDGWLSKCV